MKKVFLILMILVLFGCPQPENPASNDDGGSDGGGGSGGGGGGGSPSAEVRFQNLTADVWIYYGIGYGDSRFTFPHAGFFGPGSVTSYKSTDTGAYSVKVKNVDGDWLTGFSGSFGCSKNCVYTFVLEGSLVGGVWITMILDEG